MTEDNKTPMQSSAFAEHEVRNAARVAIGFLTNFSEFQGNQAAVPDGFVTEHFSPTRQRILQDAGALQTNPEVIDGQKKRVFDVARLEELAEQKLAEARAANRVRGSRV